MDINVFEDIGVFDMGVWAFGALPILEGWMLRDALRCGMDASPTEREVGRYARSGKESVCGSLLEMLL